MKRCDCGVFRNEIGICPNCGRGYYEITPITKIRRRLEDFLRKTDEDTILRIAKENNIKTD